MGRGGAEVQVRDVALRLADRGHQVAVVVLLNFEEFNQELHQGGVQTLALGMHRRQRSVRHACRFLRWARQFDPDIVHGHMFGGIIPARTCRLLRHRPIIISTAHSVFGRPNELRALRLTDWATDRFTFVSQEAQDRYVRDRATSIRKALVIPNGVDIDRFHPASPQHRLMARARLGVRDEFMWLAIGSFRDEAKDYGTLLRAYAKTRSQCARSTLLIAGEGALLEEKKRLAAELGLSNSVQFLGLWHDTAGLFHAADAYVLSSAYEGLPVVLLEAAASGLPVVATKVGAVESVLGSTCDLVRPGDHVGLAARMVEIQSKSDPDRKLHGKRLRERVVQWYGIDQITSQWEQVYSSEIARHHRQRLKPSAHQ